MSSETLGGFKGAGTGCQADVPGWASSRGLGRPGWAPLTRTEPLSALTQCRRTQDLLQALSQSGGSSCTVA